MSMQDLVNAVIQQRAEEILYYINSCHWSKDKAIDYVKQSTCLGNASWSKVLDIVNGSNAYII